MILKELYLYPDLVDYDEEIVHPFRDQSRSICNYLERRLKSIKFNAEGFKRICFIGKSEPSPECFVNSSNVLIVEVNFDEQKYKSLNEEQLNDFFLRNCLETPASHQAIQHNAGHGDVNPSFVSASETLIAFAEAA